jgi:hypothetical protein
VGVDADTRRRLIGQKLRVRIRPNQMEKS